MVSSNVGALGPQRPVVSDLTVVIPTLGRALLRESLGHLHSGSHWPSEVIVVHQGEDTSVRGWIDDLVLKGLNIRYISSTERGRARGVNEGIREVRTTFLAITDDDCFVAGDWVVRIAEELRAHPDRIVTGQVLATGNEPVLVVNTRSERSLQLRPRLKFDFLSGGNVAMARAIPEKIGLFDDDDALLTAEDCEYAYRALRSGVPIEFVPGIVVEHMGWRTPEQRTHQYRSYALSHGGFYGKYLRRRDPFIALRILRHTSRALLSLVIASIRGEPDRAEASRGQAFTIWRGISRGFRSVKQPPTL